jgi:hypothetical protein
VFNPCANHPDAAVRQAFQIVFKALVGPKTFATFSLEEIKDKKTGGAVLLIRATLGGKMTTVAAVDSDGVLYSSDVTTMAAKDFTAAGWNRSDS